MFLIPTDILEVQRLRAHRGVRAERSDEGVHDLGREVRRVRELLLRVAAAGRARRCAAYDAARPSTFVLGTPPSSRPRSFQAQYGSASNSAIFPSCDSLGAARSTGHA